MTALRADLDLAALTANATDAGDVADLRRDAWGHGIDAVARALARAGVRAARVDPGDRAAVTAAGLTAIDAEPTIDGRLLFGLPHAPVMRVSTRVLAVKRLLAGEGVSYGYTHRAPVDTRIALIGGGYGQGVVRSLGNSIRVEIGGALHPVVGRVAMDVCVVDVSDAPVAVGDEVVHFGGDGPARGSLATWEAASGLSATELVCAVGLRASGLRAQGADAA
ncbi:alanine racemase C-terminal domain-containing protein [Planococcus sp. APC 4015]|nr:alanine racemase C-terminal domain-containing protein [Planococcus sp. APC 4015]